MVGHKSTPYLRPMQLYHKTLGAGEPIVILHGLFGMLDNWQTLAKQLAENYLIYLVDQRNHGRSPRADTHGYPEMAEDLHDFLRAEGIPAATILGHSMGGKTAMQFALTYPEMTERLIVVDIAPKAYPGGHEGIIDALSELRPERFTGRGDAEAFLAPRIPELGVRQFLLKNLTRNKEGGYRLKINLPVLAREYPRILADISPEPDATYDGPALFVRGGRSRYVADTDLPRIRTLFPQARLETVPGAGHWVHAQAPRELLTQLIDFLKAS